MMTNQLYIKWALELKNQQNIELNKILGGKQNANEHKRN